MAISTQLRLIQVTGSLGSGAGQIDDSLSAVASSSIAAADVSVLLSNMASSLVRLHGASSFSENATGVLDHSSQIVASSSLASADAVKLYASDASGGIWIEGSSAYATVGSFDVDATAAVSLDGVGASNFTSDQGDLTLSTTTSGDLYATSVGSIYGTGATGVLMSATANNADFQALAGSANISGSDYVNIDAGPAGRLDAGTITPLAGVTLNATGGDITANSVTFDVNATGAATIDAVGASNLTTDSGNLTLSTTTSGDVVVQAAAGAVDIDADSGALSLDGSAGINIGTEADVAIDMDASSLDIDASSGFALDGAAASNVTADGGDLTLSTTTSGDLYATAAGSVYGTGATGVLMSATANNADVQALAGNVNLSGSTYVNIDAGPAGSVDMGTITPLGGMNVYGGGVIGNAADMTFLGWQNMDLDLSAAFTVDSSGGGISLDAAAASNLSTSAGVMDIVGADRLHLSASGGAVSLSGSQGVSFIADGGFAFSKDVAGGVLVMDDSSEASTYRSNFSSTTSLLAAINSLYSSISSTEATLFKNVLSSAVSAGTGITLTKVAGDSASFSADVAPNKLDVYANGQLLISGSEAERAAGSVDYAVSGASELKLAFDAAIDDALVAIDRS